MIVETINASLDGPRRDSAFSEDYTCEEKMADVRQVRILTDLVLQKCESEERERWLSEINSGMTSDDAESYIFSFLTGNWR